MAKLKLKKGTTSKSVVIKIHDITKGDGSGLTGLVFNSSGLTAYYLREGGSPTAITLATLAAINSAFSSGGFKEADATNMPGVYRLDIPDAALATGAKWVIVTVRGAANMAQTDFEIHLTEVDDDDAVRMGLTALPNANAGASGGLGLLDSSLRLMADFRAILGTTLTEGAGGRLKAALTTFLDVVSPVFTSASVNQTGDSFARIGATGSGLSSLAPAATALSNATWTNARAALLDNLNVGGNVASSVEVTSIQNNTRVVRVVPTVIERPDSGTVTLRIELLLYDSVGNMEAPDSAPTISLVNQSGTDLSARLDSTTMALVSTGRYRSIYTASVGDALEQLMFGFSVIEGGNTRAYGNTAIIVDTTAVDFTAADRTKLDAIKSQTDALTFTPISGLLNANVADWGDFGITPIVSSGFPAVDVQTISGSSALNAIWARATSSMTVVGSIGKRIADFLTGDAFVRLGAPAGASIAADIAAISNILGSTGVVLTAAERNAIADALLSRDMSAVAGVATDARAPLNALRTMRNKVTIVGTTITVYKEDDTTVAWTGTITTSASADPITEMDPA